VRLVVRRFLLSSVVLAAAFPAAGADDSLTHAERAPTAESPIESAPGEDSPFACPPDGCALRLPEDLWKEDALAKQKREHINAASVIKDQSRRQELDTRFAETPVIETRIGNTSCLSTLSFVPGLNGQSLIKFLHCGF
jgi:hypothetical protein